MDWWLLSFVFGALLSLFLPIVPSIFYFVLFTVISIVCAFIVSKRKYSLVFAGLAWMLFHGANYHNIWLDNQLEPDVVAYTSWQVVGDITNIPQYVNESWKFEFLIRSLNGKSLNREIKLRLTWQQQEYKLQHGQRWQFTAKFKPAHGLANEGGFKYKTFLRHKGIHATGYVKSKQPANLLLKPVSLRQRLFNNYVALLSSNNIPDSTKALIETLAFGERAQLSKRQWQVLTATSTQHLMAISGLHLGLVALFGFLFTKTALKLLSMFIPQKATLLQSNGLKIAIYCSVLLACFYGYLSGFAVPTLRAIVMLLVFWLLRLNALSVSKLRGLSLVLFVLCLLWPFSLFSISFWLSIYAVSLIVLSHWLWHKKTREPDTAVSLPFFAQCWHYSKVLIWMQVTLVIFMLPISASVSHHVSLAAIVANLIAVPWVSFVVLPLILCSMAVSIVSPELASHIITALSWSLALLWQWLAFLSELSWSLIAVSASWVAFFSLMVVAFFAGMIFLKRRGYIACLLLAVSSFSFVYWQRSHMASHESWQVTVLDVGQGLAVLVEVNSQVMLYDTGAAYPSGFNMVDAVILPYFRANGIKKLDRLILSHDDNDHAGGVEQLKKGIVIESHYYNDKNLATPCIAGQSFTFAHLTVKTLHPKEIAFDDNDDSCVVKITDGDINVLLPGDISSRIEKALVRQYGRGLQSNILIASHHGSKSSSAPEFINAVAPEYVVFSAGFYNRWKMPTDEVVGRYKRHEFQRAVKGRARDGKVKTYQTAHKGMVRFIIEKGDVKVQTYRDNYWPFWFAN